MLQQHISQISELKTSNEMTAFQKVINDSGGSTNEREICMRDASATTKALSQLECDGLNKIKRKRTIKVSAAARRNKFNQRLSKILTPKSALIFLHELRPGCAYKVQEQVGCNPASFSAKVHLNGQLLGTGQGLSKSQAKNSAAENAIKLIVSKSMVHCTESKEEVSTFEAQGSGPGNEGVFHTSDSLPWAGLASFAIYKMFSEWQNQGTDLLPTIQPAAKKSCVVNTPMKKAPPLNAINMHPTAVLNMVSPGLQAVELERQDSPKSRVKMAYVINGVTYSGIGGNKKDARKEAAKAVLKNIYGLCYDQ